jgi:periplasmic protein TonB
MDTMQIKNASLLDILFEGKNKAYGAYDLRKTYNKRISLSVMITLLVIALFIIAMITNNGLPDKELYHPSGTGAVIKPLPPVTPPVLPQPPAKQALHKPGTVPLPPHIVKDIPNISPPADIDQDQNVSKAGFDPGASNDSGSLHATAPIEASQVLAPVSQRKKEDPVFMPVEIEASFPGGNAAWTRFVSKAIGDNRDDFTEQDFGTCVVRFVVDTSGKVSRVEALTMKNTRLAEIAVNAIRQGPHWIPARQNGAYVNAYRLQPVTLTSPPY